MKIILSVAAIFCSFSALAACPFVVQGSGTADATTDGLLLQRYALGSRDSALVLGATRSSAVASSITDFITGNRAALDIDGNGLFEIRDALIITRHLAGFRGYALTRGAPPATAPPQRDTFSKVETYIADGCPTGNPAVTGAHPRLWLADAITLNRVTAAARVNSADWRRLKNVCDTRTEPGYDYQGAESFRMIANFALCYQVVKANSGAAAAAPYGKKAVDLLANNATYPVLAFANYANDAGYGVRNYVPAMAIAYDWLHDYPGMTPSIKTQVASRMKAWPSWYEANGYGNADNYISNYNAGFMVARTLTAIALYGEDTESATLWAKALAHYNGARQRFDVAMPGGHWPEGWSYGSTVYQNYGWAASALKIASNDSSFLNFNWLTNNVRFKASALTSDGKFFYEDGVWNSNGIGAPSLNDMIVVGHALGWSTANGQLARAYIDRAVAGGENFDYPLAEWTVFLFYDPASVPANLATLPKSCHAVGTGVVTARSDWSQPSGAWGSFVAGRYIDYQGQDRDQGHIEIYKGAPLLIDTSHGYYGDVQNTVMHNTYTLENRSDSTITGQDSYSANCPNPTGSNPIGINAYSEGDSYAFSSGEFSAAYQLKPVYPVPDDGCGVNAVTWLNRSTMYVRPNVFVVYDQILKAADESGMVPTMHLHFPTAPTRQNTNARRLTVDNGAGRLHVSTVLPASSNWIVRAETKDVSNGPGVTNWHLAVSYPGATTPAYQNFLTVMRAGDSTAAYVAPQVSAIVGSNASGSIISGLLTEESATPIVVVFAEGGAPRIVPISLQYQYSAAAVAVQHYVAKLKPNSYYAINAAAVSGTTTVTVSETASSTGSVKTDSAGVLFFLL